MKLLIEEQRRIFSTEYSPGPALSEIQPDSAIYRFAWTCFTPFCGHSGAQSPEQRRAHDLHAAVGDLPAVCRCRLHVSPRLLRNPVILTTVEHHRCNLGDWIGASAMTRALVRAAMLLPVSIFCLFAPVAHAGLDRYRDLIVADGNPRSELPKQGIRVTYLGTNAYLLESRSATLLVDPYFSRMSLLRVALNLRALPKRDLIERYLPVRQIDAVIVTHGHIDHLLDVAEVMTLTGAKLIASPTSVRLIQSFGMDRARCIPLIGGETVRLRGATVRSFAVQHDRLLGRVPFDGPPRRLPPRFVSDWVCGEPLAFLIEMGGRRLYIESGGRPGGSPCQGIGPVDLAILGVALPDARKRFPPTLQRLRPRYVLPSHQDDFFRPLSRGFTFGAGSDFPSVLRAFRTAPKRSSLILLDYFRPWTLP